MCSLPMSTKSVASGSKWTIGSHWQRNLQTFKSWNKENLEHLTKIRVHSKAESKCQYYHEIEFQISAFVKNYMALAFKVRAKLENWAINPQELTILHESKSENTETQRTAIILTQYFMDLKLKCDWLSKNPRLMKIRSTTKFERFEFSPTLSWYDLGFGKRALRHLEQGDRFFSVYAPAVLRAFCKKS